ncbi:MAG: hypothetical protein Q7T56_12400 [Nocardioidaceae bacterium]|nr:hypothetical protein [Nocardioidaceae bacterium]
MIKRSPAVVVALTMVVTVFFAALGTEAAVAANRAVMVQDKRGDGSPDIASFRARESADGVTLTVKVRNVTRGNINVGDVLTLYVDPTGKRRTPLYAFATSLSSATEWSGWETRGWKLQDGDFKDVGVNCGERVRLSKWGKTGRRMQFKMPMACFGDVKARFAVKTERINHDGEVLGSDWAPRKKKFSKTVRF